MKATNTGSDLKKPRTNKVSTTVIIGGIALLIGLVLGAAAAETGTGLITSPPKASVSAPATTPGVTGATNRGGPGS